MSKFYTTLYGHTLSFLCRIGDLLQLCGNPATLQGIAAIVVEWTSFQKWKQLHYTLSDIALDDNYNANLERC